MSSYEQTSKYALHALFEVEVVERIYKGNGLHLHHTFCLPI